MTAWSSVVVPSLWRAISARPRACRSRGSADRLGRSPATIKAYFYDPTAEKARAEGALCRRVPRLRRVYPAAQREGRRVRVLHGLPSRRDPGALEAGARAGSDAPGGPAVGWLTSTSATPIRVRRRTSTSGSLLRVVQTGSEVGADEGGCSPTRARARCACGMSRIRPAVSTPATPAIAAKQVRGTAADDVGVADDATGCASGESRVSCLVRGEPCIHIRTGIRRRGA
jgi:hypothetical protein